jgi:hypothetical protein
VIADNLSEVAGGVVLTAMDGAPSDFGKNFRILQYFYFILSALKQGHFKHVISVQRLIYGVYFMETVGGCLRRFFTCKYC